MPMKNQADVLFQWSKRYGDVVYVETMGQSIVVLGSDQAASDLLEKRSAIYSDRPRILTFELIGWGKLLGFLPYGPEFLATRKLFQQQLSKAQCVAYQDMQLQQAYIFLYYLIKKPQDFRSHLTRFVATVTAEIAYGHHVSSADDAYPKMSERVIDILIGAGIPGFNSVDMFPIQVRPEQEELQREAFGQVQTDMASTNSLYPHREIPQYDEKHLERLSLAAYHMHGVGFETTWSTIESFIFHVMLHPEVQKKCHEEIDRVLGDDKLPDFKDRETLTYLECVVQESARWHTVIPLGVPHRVMEDDIYRGMLIPKGSIVISNIQSITYDENVYHSAKTFLPERYLPKPKGYGEPFPDCNFGYGRRVCPGRYLADASVWIAAATLLAAFEIHPAKDKAGNDIIPPLEYVNNTLTSHPKTFQCEFRLRSEKMRSLIETLK
ncbi:hypothetical protein NLI96_g7376 [Meripilus lineatus]|uniref:Cytochrome P450 n=1 Tax=Meripilus lineatus TaxID=2056292 RepID=A0AAD5YF26_9APHY|nr:hypothetical protein NLI96_g7376 [Physisporinus lineatus]